jgi:hypothetical protein
MPKGAAAGKEAVHLAGSPRLLRFSGPVLASSESCELVLPSSLAPYADRQVIALPVQKRRGGGSRVHLRLAHATPPGQYTAELRVAGKTHPVKLEIHPAPWLRASPISTDFEGSPGASAATEMTLTNSGNVPIIVPETAIVWLYDDGGIEAAFAEVYRQDSDDAQVLIGHFLRGLRAGYGGPLKLEIAEGAGPVEPDQQRTLKITANIPKKLKPRHSYHGIWRIEPLRQRVKVRVLR